MNPNSIYFGLKVVSIWVLWGQSIFYLGLGFRVSWTFKDWGLGRMRDFGFLQRLFQVLLYTGFCKRSCKGAILRGS